MMDSLWHWAITFFPGSTWSVIDALVTIATVIGVGYSVYQGWKQNQKIKIYIQREDEAPQKLPVDVMRKHFSRSELFGLLGALDKESSFRIKQTSSETFLQDILSVQNGKKDSITIKINKDDKFDWDNK